MCWTCSQPSLNRPPRPSLSRLWLCVAVPASQLRVHNLAMHVDGGEDDDGDTLDGDMGASPLAMLTGGAKGTPVIPDTAVKPWGCVHLSARVPQCGRNHLVMN